MGNPCHSIIEDPSPVKGANAASVASNGHTSNQLPLDGSVHVLELLKTAELYKKGKHSVNLSSQVFIIAQLQRARQGKDSWWREIFKETLILKFHNYI